MNCKTCQYWRFIRDTDLVVDKETTWKGPHGECHRIHDLSHDETAWVDIWMGPEDPVIPIDKRNLASESSLITKPEFGCVLYENGTWPPKRK